MESALSLQIFNTLTRLKEPFAPVDAGRVKIYTCGPTVYRYAHIGNLRSYVLADWLRRLLEGSRYAVHHVKNITDVGQMRKKLPNGADCSVTAAVRAAEITPPEIAGFYTD